MFHPGQVIGQFTLIEQLGRGGFGEVWLAKSDEGRFAVKLPHKDQVDWKSITQEIGLWTLCGNHPNIMPIVGARNFNGQIAIISEYAPDGSLEDLLRAKGKLSIEEAVEITIGILEGLQHLHESGIIHRDLKPANILFDGETPRLTDFGISRIISADSLSETVSGTWAYMAPECFDGKRNVQTDIWSVGVILYRMLTGNLPFPQKEQTALIGSIIINEPMRLSTEMNPFIRKITLSILSKSSSDRPDIQYLLSEFRVYFDHNKRNLIHLENKKLVLEKQLIPYLKGNKFGFIDYGKNLIIEAKYDYAAQFVEDLALVELNGKTGFIDKTGKEVIPLKYDHAEPFSEGLADVMLKSKHGFIDKTGKEVIPFKYDFAVPFSEGLGQVRLNGKYGFIDKMGKEVIPLKYDLAGPFFDGLARVVLNGKYGFIDKNDKEVIPLKYNYAEPFTEGLASIELNGKWGFIDSTGKEFIPFKYDFADSFFEGLAEVKLNDKCGFIDKTGKEVIPLKYDGANLFSEGLAEVRLNGKWGFINKTGKEVIPLKYNYTFSFFDGLAWVNLDNKTFYIDKNGTEYYEP